MQSMRRGGGKFNFQITSGQKEPHIEFLSVDIKSSSSVWIRQACRVEGQQLIAAPSFPVTTSTTESQTIVPHLLFNVLLSRRYEDWLKQGRRLKVFCAALKTPAAVCATLNLYSQLFWPELLNSTTQGGQNSKLGQYANGQILWLKRCYSRATN